MTPKTDNGDIGRPENHEPLTKAILSLCQDISGVEGLDEFLRDGDENTLRIGAMTCRRTSILLCMKSEEDNENVTQNGST